MLERPLDTARLRDSLGRSPAVVLVGPRQAGKSTLARSVVKADAGSVFDLEDPRDLARLGEPTLSLSGRPGTIVLDEAQRAPDLFPALRVLIDEDRRPGRFLVLGSASPDLIGMASESLAGRVEILELPGFRAQDVGEAGFTELWQRGGLPPSYTAPDDESSTRWRDAYIATFLERDLTALGFRLPSTTMRRFWTMLAHYHGQTWNGAELARALAMSEPSVRRYLDALTDALVVRQLPPWFANLSKRQVRSPKVYIRDTGLLHALLGITDETTLLGHPKVGASWEGFIVEQLLTLLEPRDPSFWATHAGAELDLRLELRGRRIGIEIKRTDRPSTTPSIRAALADLDLDQVFIMHAGTTPRFQLSSQVTAIPARDVLLTGPTALDP